MLAGIKYVLGAAMMTTLMSIGVVSGECDIYVVNSGSLPRYGPCPCQYAHIWYMISYPASEECEATNLVVTLELKEPVIIGTSYFYTWGSGSSYVSGEVAADKKSVTFNVDELEYYVESSNEYTGTVFVSVDICEISPSVDAGSEVLPWNDLFQGISYADDQNNTLDSSAFEAENIYMHDVFDGVCVTGRATSSPAVTVTPAPTPAATVRDLCEENTFSSDGLPPCSDCPAGETSGRGAVVCEEASTPAPTTLSATPSPTPTPTTIIATPSPTSPTTPAPTTATPRTPSPVDETSSSAPISLGCYEDVGSDRIMEDRALVDDSMTTELCELTCAGSTYFSTQFGRECWCGSSEADYAKHGESMDCTYVCPGNPDQICGGRDAATVYAYAGDNTPALATTAPITSPPTVTPPTTSPYLGCFEDDRGDRIMEIALTDSTSMTQEMCETECTGSTYFGLQYARECWCGGQDTDAMKHGESTACDYECTGNPDQICGGFDAMSVYEVVDV